MRIGIIHAVMDSKRSLSLVPGINQGCEDEQHRKNCSRQNRRNPAWRGEMACKISSKSGLRTLHDVSLGPTKRYRPGQGLSEENIVSNQLLLECGFPPSRLRSPLRF